MTSTGTMPDDSVVATAKPPLLTFCIMAFADYAMIDDIRTIITGSTIPGFSAQDHIPQAKARQRQEMAWTAG